MARTAETWTPVTPTAETYTAQAENDDFLLDYLITEDGRVVLTEGHIGLRP